MCVQVLKDAVEAGKRVGAIFKEPTVTPSAAQVISMGLKKPLSSPNGAMRRGWNGITISRDTIHIDGVKLGFERPVFFEVGGCCCVAYCCSLVKCLSVCE